MRKLFATAALCALIGSLAVAQPRVRVYTTGKDKSGNSQKGWLGVSIQDVTSHLKRSMDLKTSEGALVSDVVDDSPADSAGMKEGDVIVRFDSRDIADASDLQEAVAKTKPGTKVLIDILRKGEKKTLQVVIGAYPESGRFSVVIPRGAGPRVFVGERAMVQGLTLRTLSDQLAQYFEVPDNEGVLVWEVKKESPADKAGIKAGDVITKVGGKRIREIRDVSRALGAFDEGEKVNVDIVRKGARKSLSLEVAEEKNPRWFNFRFDRPRIDRDLRGFYFEGMPDIDIDIDVPRLEMERIRPDMDALRIEMGHVRDQLRDEMGRVREELRRNLRTPVIVRETRHI